MEPMPLDSPSEEENVNFVERGMTIRFLSSIAWFVLIVVITELAIGMFVGNSVTDGQMTFKEGLEAGAAAEELITPKYWWVILLGQISLWLVLSIWGKLPGTAKLKSVA